MAAPKYYPPLSSYFDFEDLPDELSFIKNVDFPLFDRILVKRKFISKNRQGQTSIDLTLIVYKSLKFEIPGTGLGLIMNPPQYEIEPGVSEFNISIQIKSLLSFIIRNKEINNSLFDLSELFEIAVSYLRMPLNDLYYHAISTMTADGKIQRFVSRINSFYSLSPQLVTYTSENLLVGDVNNLIAQLEESSQLQDSGISTYDVLFDLFIENNIDDSDTSRSLNKLFYPWINGSIESLIKRLLIPEIYASIHLGLALEIPRKYLIPLDNVTNEPIPVDDPENPPQTLLLFAQGDFIFNSRSGIGYDQDLSLSLIPTKSQIGGTGLTITFENAKFDISRTKNIEEAQYLPDDFVGLFVGNAVIGFPAFWNHDQPNSTGELKATNLLIGTGGISGTIKLQAKSGVTTAPLIEARFGGDSSDNGFSVQLLGFDLTFQQNAIIGSNIFGSLTIPGFKKKPAVEGDPEEPMIIGIKVHIGTDGEFNVTASGDDFISLRLPGIFDFNIDSLSIGREEARFFIAVSGSIDFIDQGGTIGQFLPDKVDIQKLIIWQDGEIEFQGGTIVLPKAITLKIKPVELSITAIGLGSHEQPYQGISRKYKFFEFSGGISINPGGVDARGDGIKFYYTVDNGPGKDAHRFVRIQGIGIDIIIPGSAKPEDAAVLLKGYLAMKDPAPGNERAGTEYAGGIDFTLPKLKMGGSAAMRLNPKVPAFIVDLGLEIATPIPLGSTGLGIYGFRGLVGQRYVATKTAAGVAEDGEWWQYYKAKTSPDNREGIFPAKFSQENGVSLGAGVSLATSADSGRTFSSKLFFLLSLPEVFLFQGQAQVLKERIGLDTTSDPPFFALIAISKKSIEAAFGINYKIPDDGNRPGSIAKVDALIELGFFFGDSSSWYLNIGRDQPESRRVNVRLLELFDAYFYLMIGSSGIRAGAGAKFEVTKKFGPLRAELGAYLDIAGKIAFKPKQYGASIQLGGKVGLYIFKFGFSVSANAGLAAEAPKPFIVTGSLKVCVRVLKKDRCAEFEFTWIKDNSLDTSPIAILNPQAGVKALNMLTRESFPLYVHEGSKDALTPANLDPFAIPMDSFIDFEFLKGVLPSADVRSQFGGNTQAVKYVDYVSPQKSKSSRVRHEYHLNTITIWAHSNTDGWIPYDIYDAATPLELAPFVTADLTTLKKGYWQYHQTNLHNKLRIMAQTPLNFISQGSGGIIPEESGVTDGTIFCAPATDLKSCFDFKDGGTGTSEGQILKVIPKNVLRDKNTALIRITGGDGQIVHYPDHGINNALALKGGDTLEINFKEPVAYHSLKMSTSAPDVRVTYYRKVQLPDLSGSNMPQFEEQGVLSVVIARADLVNPVVYDDLTTPIDKVVIESSITDEIGILYCTWDYSSGTYSGSLILFLASLITNNQLTKTFNLYPDVHYTGRFQGTILYPFPIKSNTVITYTSVISGRDLNITITDNFGFSTSIYLKNLTFDWPSDIFHDAPFGFGLYPSPHEVLGLNYEFIGSVNISPTYRFDYEGRSDYPIQECTGDRSLFIYQSCQTTFEDALFVNSGPDETTVQQETDTMIAGINESIQPVWRPDTYYAIEVNVEDRMFLDNDSSVLTSSNNTFSFGFRTKGPIGFFHEGNQQYNDLKGKDREAEYKLANLQHYIDYQKSYPNADGALINAKPLFYINPELHLFYLKNYVFEFYRDWDTYIGDEVQLELKTLIKDPAPDTTVVAPASLPVSWVQNALPGFMADVTALGNMITNGDPCAATTPLSPMGVNANVAIYELKPLKLYTALFIARHKPAGATTYSESEVHRYVFQTSRYRNFADQVNSFILERDAADPTIVTKEAKFEIDLAPTTNLSTAQMILNGTLNATSILRRNYADNYDKLIVGTFALGYLPPAVTTEFNIVKVGGNIIGILIRNPEPFNDPKIPLAVLLDTIVAQAPAVTLNVKLFSKDKRNVFITNSTMTVPADTYAFGFKYKEWTGATYSVKSDLTVNLIIN